MNVKEIAQSLAVEFEKVKTVTFKYDESDDSIIICCKRHKNVAAPITYKQIEYIFSLENVEKTSRNNLGKTNKYAGSAIISAAKKYENVTFYLNI